MQQLRVEGSGYERGLQQAKAVGPQALDEARMALSRLHVMPKRLPQFLKPRLVDLIIGDFGRKYWKRHQQTLAHYAGGKFLGAMKGLAEGLGVAPQRVYGYGAFEIEAARFHFTFGCSSFAFSKDATAWGRPLLAYNHDFPPELSGMPFVRENVPDVGLASVSLAYPLILGTLCGVNEAGLALSLNHAWVRELSTGEALPITLLMQDTLDTCRSVEEAIAHVSRVPVANGSMVTLLDASGARAVVELTPKGAFVRRTKRAVQETFNAYQTPGARRLEVPVGAIGTGPIEGLDIHSMNLSRQARYDALEVCDAKGWSMEQVNALCGDHDEKGIPTLDCICRHDDPIGETLLTARVDPMERTLQFSPGVACRPKFETFSVPQKLRAAA